MIQTQKLQISLKFDRTNMYHINSYKTDNCLVISNTLKKVPFVTHSLISNVPQILTKGVTALVSIWGTTKRIKMYWTFLQLRCNMLGRKSADPFYDF